MTNRLTAALATATLVLALGPAPARPGAPPDALRPSPGPGAAVRSAPDASFPHLRPNRVLVVAGVQMRDEAVIRAAWDFGDIVALLKLWGVPFDIMRLDLHRMELADFADTAGRAKYGAIVWTARRQDDHPWSPQDYRVAAQAVTNLHIGFIAVGNKIQEKPIQDILGLRYRDFGEFEDPVTVGPAAHFVTRGLEKESVAASEAFEDGGAMVSIEDPSAAVLAKAGRWPQLVARTVDAASRTRAVWIGGNPDGVFRTVPFFIKVLRRALVWVRGYGFTKDYGKSVVLRMDDPGSSQSAYFKSWDYAQLDEAAVRGLVLEPLRARKAPLGVGYCPGYPWIADRTVRPSAYVDFTDSQGVRQNIASGRAGWLAGMKEGLIEIQSHGLTHMAPDLDTPPPGGKSWWDGSWTDEWPTEGWYREFYDERRDREVDEATQLTLLRKSADWIERDFGRRPLVFIPGGYAISGDWFVEGETENEMVDGKPRLSYIPPYIGETFTYKLAAQAGYGLALDEGAHYLGPDYVISLGPCSVNNLPGCFARGVPAVRYFHDRDLRLDPGYLPRLLTEIDRDAHFMSMDEWVGYLHARLDVDAPAPDSLRLTFACDPPYGRYFADHQAVWTFDLSDDLLEDLKRLGPVFVSLDGADARAVEAASYFSEHLTLTFSGGAGRHALTISKPGKGI
jgi:hypothetical protein